MQSFMEEKGKEIKKLTNELTFIYLKGNERKEANEGRNLFRVRFIAPNQAGNVKFG